MKYRILKIIKASANYYDVDYQEVPWFGEGKVFKGVRTEFSSVLGIIVSTGKYLHNFRQILAAYNYDSVDFTRRKEPLPIVHTSGGRAIY